MLILSLEIDNFRHLQRLVLPCSPGLNLIVGPNASGKTSLLEALYFLGRARSFRTRQVRELIRHGEAAFRLVASLGEAPEGRRIVVGLERNRQSLTIRIDGEAADSLAQLARQAPVLLLTANSHRLLEEGPRQRRRFLDWGLFHTEAAFWPAWKRYAAALRNRNAALRAHSPERVLDAWEQELAAAAQPLNQFREAFCKALGGVLSGLIGEALGKVAPRLEYRPGWPLEAELPAALRQGREQDRRLGYTQWGPHRADVLIRLAGRPVTEILSRGQQKLLIITLILAQAQLYRTRQGSACILLIDDLPAELDRTHREWVLRRLADSAMQLFVTAIEPEALDPCALAGRPDRRAGPWRYR